MVILGLLTGVSCARNGETHVYQGSPLLVSVLGCTRLSRVHSRRVAAAAVVHVEEQSRIGRIQCSPRCCGQLFRLWAFVSAFLSVNLGLGLGLAEEAYLQHSKTVFC